MEWLIFWILLGFVSAIVASGRGGNGCLWFGIGVLLGPFGLILAFVVPGSTCPHCKSKIHPQAAICGKCQTPLSKATTPLEARPSSGLPGTPKARTRPAPSLDSMNWDELIEEAQKLGLDTNDVPRRAKFIAQIVAERKKQGGA